MGSRFGQKCFGIYSLLLFILLVLFTLLYHPNFQLKMESSSFLHLVQQKFKYKEVGILESMQQKNEFGYVLATHFSDQITSASGNIFSLQCWASTISNNMKVVEPFIRLGSFFGYSLRDGVTNNHTSDNDSVRLSDVYDMASWERESSKRGFAPLISWENFLKQAPRNLIVVGTKEKYRYQLSWGTFRALSESFAEKFSFKIVRIVNYQVKLYSSEEFRSTVYGNYTPNQTVVLFRKWGGIVSSAVVRYRIGISDMNERCKSIATLDHQLSSSIALDAQRYQEKYFPQGNSHSYISIMFRMERVAWNHFKSSQSNQTKLQILTKCEECLSSHGLYKAWIRHL